LTLAIFRKLLGSVLTRHNKFGQGFPSKIGFSPLPLSRALKADMMKIKVAEKVGQVLLILKEPSSSA
jgi:hypothetical protein